MVRATVSTKFKIYAALLLFSATLAAGRLAGPSLMDWCRRRLGPQEPATPPVEDWPKLQLVVDPTLHCPPSESPRHVLSQTIDAALAANGRRFVHCALPNLYGGERFELAFLPNSSGTFDVGALGRKVVDYGPPYEHVFDDLQGVITVNTLDWREREPIHVRLDLHYYDTESSRPRSTELGGQATPTREE